MQVTEFLPTGFVVALLDDLWISGELVDKGEILQVDRAVRNDWIGSKLARDATDDEIEKYRAEEAEAAAEAAAEAEEKAKADAAAAKKAGK